MNIYIYHFLWDKHGHLYPNLWPIMWTTFKLHPCETNHYNDVIMGTMASQITSLTIVYSTFYSGANQRKPQSFASLAFVWGNYRGPVNSPHKWPVTRKMIPFDDVIVKSQSFMQIWSVVYALNSMLALHICVNQGNTSIAPPQLKLIRHMNKSFFSATVGG